MRHGQIEMAFGSFRRQTHALGEQRRRLLDVAAPQRFDPLREDFSRILIPWSPVHSEKPPLVCVPQRQKVTMAGLGTLTRMIDGVTQVT